jgi:hypothetical protein
MIERRRMVTADASIPGSKQPYHAAERLDAGKAETLIRICRVSSARLASEGVRDVVARLAQNGHRVIGTGVLFASGRPLPDLAAILQSHALIHTAEGEFYRQILVEASEHCSLPVTRVKEREVWDRGAAILRLGLEDLQRRIGELGRSLGPPWREDEKLASLAAWIVLAEAG